MPRDSPIIKTCNQKDKMGKQFRKGGNAASTSGGDGGLTDEQLRALADKTSFSLENVKDFHEVKDLVHLIPLTEN